MLDRSLWPIKVKHNKMSAIKEAFCMPHLSLTFVFMARYHVPKLIVFIAFSCS